MRMLLKTLNPKVHHFMVCFITMALEPHLQGNGIVDPCSHHRKHIHNFHLAGGCQWQCHEKRSQSLCTPRINRIPSDEAPRLWGFTPEAKRKSALSKLKTFNSNLRQSKTILSNLCFYNNHSRHTRSFSCSRRGRSLVVVRSEPKLVGWSSVDPDLVALKAQRK